MAVSVYVKCTTLSPEAQNPDVWRAYYRRKFLELASVLLTRERVSSFFSPLTISTSPPPHPLPLPSHAPPIPLVNPTLYSITLNLTPTLSITLDVLHNAQKIIPSTLAYSLHHSLSHHTSYTQKKKSLPRSQRPFPNSSGVSSGTSFCVLQGYTASEREAWRTFVLSLPWIFNSDLRVSSPSRVLAEFTIS